MAAYIMTEEEHNARKSEERGAEQDSSQGVRAFAAKPDGLILIPGTLEGEKELLQVVL